MSETRQKCAETYPSDPGKPYFNMCWGFRPLPSSINFEVSGFRSIGSALNCPHAGKGPYTGTMARMSPCEFNYAWSNGEFGIVLSVNENRPPLSQKIDQTNADMTKWHVGGTLTEKQKTAYCTMTDPPLGKVRLEIAGVIGDDVCEADFRIWVEET